ncbi:hypothetical protein F5146DRAFT_1004507 [Armillaria mellea]|nr:hypothetical protein F5146DRAFT_1004507 [Armillaria mellea]
MLWAIREYGFKERNLKMNKPMGYEGVWLYRGMGYYRVDCNRIGDGSLNIIGIFSASSKHEYAIQMYYSEEQRLWLAEYGSAFKQAVLGHTLLPFFEGLCWEFFHMWLEDEPKMLMEEEWIADEEQ